MLVLGGLQRLNIAKAVESYTERQSSYCEAGAVGSLSIRTDKGRREYAGMFGYQCCGYLHRPLDYSSNEKARVRLPGSPCGTVVLKVALG